ncbi:MAG: 3-ketosteroid-delta-1-dehydrogenase [Salana multivorans]|uniref:3-ketosteroid-delta-1-dehydrogenase n=1 Tax=Salana multivorans TaxID=120377 RepID=UPI000964D72A|nr:3-ketosteroid-delta-1-dehydrogenase [Salana multivorans]MBN8883505.1 3-ketosteroid-delta-1-dehydrogenase [Salana multivorans]OJX93960.1 MAG: 3-ketosteroid-delta-1-dehydrogenase [Micrococcales bacterium 73-15]
MPTTTTSTPRGPRAVDATVDLLVIGSGTGMAAALAATELGLDALVVEKTELVGGSTARSGGAFWVPANPALLADGSTDTLEQGETYLDAVVGDSAPKARRDAFLRNGPAAVAMLQRLTPLEFFWARGYSDYHPELPGGMAVGRTCEAKPFNAAVLGPELARLRGGVVEAPVPMPVTGADYKWMNLMMRKPLVAWPKILKRATQGIGGMAVGRHYTAGGQAIAAGLFAGLVSAGVPVWTRTALTELVVEAGRVVGAVLTQDGREVTVRARRGVVLAAGGFDHDMAWRHRYQSPSLLPDASLGSPGNTGDAIRAGLAVGGELDLMREAWWFPAVAPAGPDAAPQVLLAERSLPGSFIVDQDGRRFLNEAEDYMSYGQRVLDLEAAGTPVTQMWLVFDQTYRNRYMFAGSVYPGAPLPKEWYEAGIAVQADDARGLAAAAGLPEDDFVAQLERFNQLASSGVDGDFGRGNSAYDRYYGDPTEQPNPNLRPLGGKLYAVRVVLSDLGTCGGLRADEHGRVVRAAADASTDGAVVEGLYALGNTAANAFGTTYPGAGATIGEGLVYGYIVARHAASLG